MKKAHNEVPEKPEKSEKPKRKPLADVEDTPKNKRSQC
jgi:hypothetical protein